MYQALYRKWRPMTFSDVVGQPQVTDTLKKQVASGRLSHAYLFTGTRGTGKTTCAKILAKAANCENPRGGEPCNECPSCAGINSGAISDVIEIDAASNSGVDNIRTIRDQTAFSPVETRMRVYIIDECHMLSGGAFNALLKTLEEPPSHVLFILATTELHKVPATILSRCQRFSFRRIGAKSIANRLSEIAESENITLAEPAAALISRLADGGMRDAISMLDQIAAATDAPIGENEVLAALGLAGENDTLAIAKAIEAHDAKSALDFLAALYSGGRDISSFLGELSLLFRDVLIMKTTCDSGLLSGAYTTGDISAFALTPARLLSILGAIGDTQVKIQRSVNVHLDSELLLIILCDEALGDGIAGLSARLERLENTAKSGGFAKIQNVQPPTQAAAPVSPCAAKLPAEGAPPWESPVENAADSYNEAPSWEDVPDKPSSEKIPTAENSAEPQPEAPKSVPDGGWWQAVLSAVRGKLSMSVYSQLATQKTPYLDGDRLCIYAASEFSKKMLASHAVVSEIESAATAQLRTPVKCSIMLAGEKPSEPKDDGLDKLKKLAEKFDNLIIE